MENLKEQTLAALVNRHTAAAVVFEKHRLDFCCKGKRSLDEACQSQGLDAARIAGELERFINGNPDPSAQEFQNMSIDKLADYIESRHHTYVRERIPLITAHTQKVAERHGMNNSSLVEIADLWEDIAHELTRHMFKEERILFPYIRNMVKAGMYGTPVQAFVANPIKIMEHEHDSAGEGMAKIRALSNDYTPPLIACTTYRLCFTELKEFEEDLHQHVHLENNLLFPKAIAMEAMLLRQTMSLQ